MPFLTIAIDGKRIADAVDRLTDVMTRIAIALGVPDADATPPPEPKTADALAAEVTYDTDEDRKRRELEAMALRGSGEEAADDAVHYGPGGD